MKLHDKESTPYYPLKKHWKILTKYYGDLSSKHFYFEALRSMTAKETREILPDVIHQMKQSKTP